ncbi:hypothetical protein [Mesorhizobium sp. M0488]|uniref:hypothetical protein n=1 Tax=unclassified Mesorhizobium TaxID=325217 RepID=UPI00333D6B8B
MNAILTTIDRRGLLVGLASLPAIAGAVALSPPASASDPLADTLAEYYAKISEFMAIPTDEITMENEGTLVAATYGPVVEKLWHATPPTTSIRGVTEAIRYAVEQDCIIDYMAAAMLVSALAFLDQERVS